MHRDRLPLALGAALLAFAPWAFAGAPTVVPVTRTHPAAVSDTALGYHDQGTISGDGRYVVLVSDSPNLTAGFVQPPYFDRPNVFLLDRATGDMTLVSHAVASLVQPGSQNSYDAVLSADGRYVAFLSDANDLVAGLTGNSYGNVYLYDRLAGTNTLVSHTVGAPLTAVGFSGPVLVSADGSHLAFESGATNLVAGQSDVAGTDDVFLYDSASGQTRLVSHTPTGAATTSNRDANLGALSADGRFVAFLSDGTNFVAGLLDVNAQDDLFLFDGVGGFVTIVSHAAALPLVAANSGSSDAHLSAGGMQLAFTSGATDLVAGQTGGSMYDTQVFLYDAAAGVTRLVSHATSSPTTACNNGAEKPLVSADGSTFAFESAATDLVTPSPGFGTNVYAFDGATGANTLASRDAGLAGIGGSLSSLSGDGRYVAYTSDGNPGFNDTNGRSDVFVFDRVSSSTRLVSARAGVPDTTANGESQDASSSGDGLVVALRSAATDLCAGVGDTNGGFDIFANEAGTTAVVTRRDPQAAPSTGQAGGELGSVSDNGRYVVFNSSSPDLVAGYTKVDLYVPDVFLFDRQTNATTLLSHALGNALAGAGGDSGVISGDGRWIAFSSRALLVSGISDPSSVNKTYLYDRTSGAVALASHAVGTPNVAPDGGSEPLALSSDGHYLLLRSGASNLVAGSDPGNSLDLFLYDRLTGNAALVTHQAGSPTTACGPNADGEAVLSADGRYVAYEHSATNLVVGQVDTNSFEDVFLYDRVSGNNLLVDHHAGAAATTAGGGAGSPSISGDGGWVVFSSFSDDVVPGQVDDGGSDVFLFERATGNVRLVSHALGAANTAANDAWDGAISSDGRWTAFSSSANNLVAGVSDPGTNEDAFLYDRTTDLSLLVSHSALGALTAAAGYSKYPRPSADGSQVAYVSDAPDLVSGVDTNDTFDAFRYSRPSGQNVLASPRYGTTATAAGGLTFGDCVISADGSSVVYESDSRELVPNDFNYAMDIFMYTSLHVKGDLNDDLDTDLLLRSLSQPVNRVWTLDGDANRLAEVDLVPDQSSVDWELVGADDFNADLHSDLVFRNRTTGAVEFWMMTGTTRQGAPVALGAPPPAPALDWKLAATGDFDHDGKPDLLWRNSVNQQLQVWTMNGVNQTGTTVPVPSSAAAWNWEVVAALDLDLDGNTDLLWYNTTSGRIVRWLMDAQVHRLVGEFTNPMQAGNNNWKVLAGGDYGPGPGGLPGTRDLVWRNASSGNYVIWHMDTRGNRTSGRFTNPASPANPLNWTIAGPR